MRSTRATTYRRLPVAAALAAVLGLAALAGCGGSDEQEWKGETLEIGSIFSTTGPGVAFGPQQVKAASLAAREINRDGGVKGARIAIHQRDDGSDPARAARAMRTLIESDRSIAVLGPTFSNAAAEADPVADRLQTPVLAVSNTGPGIVGDCPYPCTFIFRDSLGEAAAIPANVGAFMDEHPARTAVLARPAEDPFGASTAAIARKALTDGGAKIKAEVVLRPASTGPGTGSGGGFTAKSSAALAGALDAKPDLLMITASSGESAAASIKAARATGYRGAILGGNAFNSRLAAENAGAKGKGAQSASAWFAGNDSEENRGFVSSYRRAYHQQPDQFAAQAYTGVKLLAAAAEDADLDFDGAEGDRKRLRAALEHVDIETPLGRFAFTGDRDVSQPIWIVAMNGKGGYDLVKVIPAG